MLKYLKFQNFRSYYDEAILSMEVKDEREKKNCIALHPSIVSENIYRTMMFIGFNGAGKSNLLSVLNYIEFLVTYQKSSKSERNIFTSTDESFRFFESAENEPRYFEIGIVEDETYFEYSFKISKSKVIEEMLKCREKNKEADRLQKIKVLFRREGDKIIEGADDFIGISKFYNIAPDLLFISACASHTFKEQSCPLGKKFIDWFWRFDSTSQSELITFDDTQGKNLERLTRFLRKTDRALQRIELNKLKIDIPVEKEDDTNTIINYFKAKGIRPNEVILVKMHDGLYLLDLDFAYKQYKTPDDIGEPKEIKERVFSGKFHISNGQRKLIMLMARVFEALENGNVLIVDELDSSLHHSFPKFVIDLFNDESVNTKNAQLIFSSHDSSLLDKYLSKAQIKYIKKDQYGRSSINELTKDGKPIKSDLRISKFFLSDEFDIDINLSLSDFR